MWLFELKRIRTQGTGIYDFTVAAHALRLDPHAEFYSLPLELYGRGDPFATYLDALDPGALASFGARHPRIFFIEARFADAAGADHAHATQAWLDCHYSFITQTSSNAVTVRLYATTQTAIGIGGACIGS